MNMSVMSVMKENGMKIQCLREGGAGKSYSMS